MKNPERAIISILCGVVAGLMYLLLAACGSTVVKDRPVRVNVPVPQPCALERPEPPELLKNQGGLNWSELDVRQKAAAVGKQAVDWMTYADKLKAATAGCP